MIFRPVLAAKVLDGTKTETRRPVKRDAVVSPYRAGRDYAVQDKRGGRALARIYVERVERSIVGAIDEDAARREGFGSRDEFVDYWRMLYRGTWDESTPVWVISFRLMRPCIACDRLTERLYSIDMDVPAFAACDTLCVTVALMPEADRPKNFSRR